MKEIIGREKEMHQLEGFENSDKSEFVAIYGRRRVGKTFLVNEMYSGKCVFEISGVIDGNKQDQLEAFVDGFKSVGYKVDRFPTTWREAFGLLIKYLEGIKSRKKKIIFIDELPCLDTKKSGLIKVLDHFWNAWAQKRDDIMLIVCGSATSWMVRNIIDNHGGLHNRITGEIHLSPFTLHETELYLQANKCKWNRLSITQLYMAIGGIPYYLSLLNYSDSLAQNMDRLFFSKSGQLNTEYKRLYKSLFRTPERYMKVIELLSNSKDGLTRDEIGRAIKVDSGGYLSDILEDLENCDFIISTRTRGKKINSKSCIYKLVDFYTIFYHKFCKKRTTDSHYWSNMLGTSNLDSWSGLAYERICMSHVPQILKSLGVDRIHTEYYSWRSKDSDKPAQIDLIIERADQIVNVCEIKFSKTEYTISADEEKKIRNRVESFTRETSIHHGVVPTMITTYGLHHNIHSDIITAEVTLDSLFVE